MSHYERAQVVAWEYRPQWVGRDGVYIVYADVQESEVHVCYKGDKRPVWLPHEVDGVPVVAVCGGAS